MRSARSVNFTAVALLVATATATVPTAIAAAGDTSDRYLFAVNHQGNFPDFGDTLIRFHPDDPEGYETIGPLDVPNTGFGGLAFDGDGNLWAYATFNNFGGAASGLYSVDPETADMSLQGANSGQTLNDLAWNPVDQTMYGVHTQAFQVSRLFTVDLQSGDVTLVGELTGFEDVERNVVGLAINSEGNVYIHDNFNNKFYTSDENLNLTLLYAPPDTQCEGCALAVGGQGIGIDWSRDDTGYHTSAGQGEFPEYYGTLNTFALDGSAYVWGPSFGEPLGKGPQFPPQVQGGDVTARPDLGAVPGDLDDDGEVGTSDLLILLGVWGMCDDPKDCPADLDGSGSVDTADLLMLLSNWG